MNKVARSSITSGRIQEFARDTNFAEYKLTYPLLGIKKCHYEAKVAKVGDYEHAKYEIAATLVLQDSIDGSNFSKDIKLNEDVDLLEKEDDSGEGFLVTGSSVDLDEVALQIIVSSLPIKVTSGKSQLPKDGKGYRVLNEDEAKKESENSYNPAFDSLKDFDTEK
jgi:hypothetical protein